MKFVARSTEAGCEAKIWVNDQSPAIRFILPENSLEAWQCALEKAQAEPWFEALQKAFLTGKISFLSQFVPEDQQREENRNDAIFERLAFTRLLLACKRLTGSKIQPSISEVLTENPSLRPFWRTWPFCWLLLQGDALFTTSAASTVHELKVLCIDYLEREKNNEKSRTGDKQFLGDFLPNLDLLRALTHEQVTQNPGRHLEIMKKYAGVTLAILDYLDVLSKEHHNLEQQITFHRFVQAYRHHLLALLVENETFTLEERQRYLSDLLTCNIMEEERWLLVQRILADMEEEATNIETCYTVETIASLMAEHYLKRYALDEAIKIWTKVRHLKRDGWLKTTLSLYHSSFGSWLTLLLWLSLCWLLPGSWKLILALPGLLALIMVVLLGLANTIIRFSSGRGFSALELILPRLAGAVFVGLSILAMENTIWGVSINLPFFSWLLLSVAAFLGALAYIFLDVHKNTRLLPLSPSRKVTRTEENLSAMQRSIRTSWHIFCIGAFEALSLATVVTSFLPLDKDLSLYAQPLWNWQNISVSIVKSYGVIVDWERYLHLTFFPKIIILWGGLALLLGAFAQLLWQDRQITAS